jgi:Secretion system C-terminal sorting domain/Concanavalin A-like lectin/glucanases superfamily
MKLYVDGVLKSIDSTTFTTYPTYGYTDPMLSFTCFTRIGSKLANTEFFHGKIDDVRIYKRAIKASEVTALYNVTASGNATIDFSVSKFNLSPNPTSGNATLNYKLNQYSNASFQLFDIQGKLVYQTELNTNDDKAILALDKLDNGLYFGSVYADGILVKTEKIVKSN